MWLIVHNSWVTAQIFVTLLVLLAGGIDVAEWVGGVCSPFQVWCASAARVRCASVVIMVASTAACYVLFSLAWRSISPMHGHLLITVIVLVLAGSAVPVGHRVLRAFACFHCRALSLQGAFWVWTHCLLTANGSTAPWHFFYMAELIQARIVYTIQAACVPCLGLPAACIYGTLFPCLHLLDCSCWAVPCAPGRTTFCSMKAPCCRLTGWNLL